jgi:sarcosine oxidase gamma subunit
MQKGVIYLSLFKLRFARIAAILAFLCLAMGAQAQSTLGASMRGFVVGAEFTGFMNAYPSIAMGQGSVWWFGYRPDIPQDPTTHTEVPVTYGANGINDGGFPNGDDWPIPTTHVTFNPGIDYPGASALPALDIFNHATLYAKNSGAYPGINQLSVNATGNFIDGTTVTANGAHWGGFYGVFQGSNGSLTANGFPWSSSGSDYGYFNAGDPNYVPFAPGPSAVNFYIYDVRGSTPTLDADGHYTYDLTSAPDNVSATTNKARGRLTIQRKDFSARWEYGLSASNNVYANTFILQGVYEIVNVEGSFTSVYSTADIGTVVGAYGQPTRFFPGLNYNDYNFYNVFDTATHFEKSMVYQFLAAGISITRTWDAANNVIIETVTNTGDVALSNVIVSDTQAANSAPFNLAPGQTSTVKLTPTGSTPGNGTATATSHVFGIERATDLNNSNVTSADASTNVNGVPDANIIQVTATSSTTLLAADLTISGYVYAQQNNANTGVGNVTVTLNGTDLNGNPVSLSTTTASDGSYSFPNVAPGNYDVVETVPGSYNAVDAQPGTGGSKVSVTDISVAATTVGTALYASQNFILNLQTGAISGTVYLDANKNSKYDSGDTGLSGITVTLKDSNGNTIATTNTDSNGNYSFPGLAPGSYTVSVPNTASGYALETANPLNATVTAGNTTGNVNFGYLPQTGSLSGTVYLDCNKNSKYDTGDAALSGVTVTLKDSNGNTIATKTTDSNGNYSFTGLAPGNYTVSVPATVGNDVIETTSPLKVTVSANANSGNNNFGYIASAPGCICGTVYLDMNKDSKFDCGDIALSQVKVTIKDSNGNVVATVTTDCNGNYSVCNLPAGTYTVSVPSSYGCDAIETANPLTVTVISGKCTSNVNFAYAVPPTGKICGTVYSDCNKNGKFDCGDYSMNGVQVTLKDCNGKTTTVTTDCNGNYSFCNVPVGTCTVSVCSTVSWYCRTYNIEGSCSLSVKVSANQTCCNVNFAYTPKCW